uniref:Zonadhesin n=1 Tax=Geotrypetes seraphini TaxID=260995 RepID=A0A6P8SA15_GEOSA|nr:IgGFc-binding protein-like [Geotrypetes seraphini]
MCSEKCSCPSAGSKLICVDGTCPEHQYCGISNGKPGCYPYTYGICRIHNDPYYNTFDKMTHSFMGICTYTLAKLCTNSTSLPYFNIEAKNEHRGNSHVSYVQKVDVEVYDHKIVMIRREPNRVLVNKMWRNLPVTLAGGSLKISKSGWSILLETDFRMTVSYDTDHSVEVKVPTTYFNLTCGMCGNFNSRGEDDYMMPNGEQAQNSIQLGNSWSTVNDPSCEVIPPTHGPCVLEELYKSDAFCGLLTSKDAPFSVCHSVINPESFFDTCVLEHCAGNQVLCQALQVYADACQREKVAVPSWRNSTFCPKPCRTNSHYNACMTACPATCVDPSAPENCSKPCIEGCECDDGYVDSGNTCVLRADCGCWYKEKYYTKGESFMEGNCEIKCQCMGNNRVECVSVTCGPDEICKVQNGLLGCHQASTATCHIYGDPHYATFDGKVHHFQGSCNYTVAETCGNSSVGFSVTTRNEYRGNPSWTALNSVALSVNGIHIAVRKHNHVYVNNGLLTGCPASPTPGINISCTTSHTIISTNFGLELQFDGDQELFVRVKEYYKGSLCGLCGTYTNNQEDDFMKPDGVVVPDFNEFGNSWRVPDDEWPCNATTDPKPCPPALQQTAEEDCKALTMTNGPFSPCHSLIPPNVYFESCVYDQCATGGSSDQLCVVLASYAAACEAAGILLGDWRKGTICDLSSTPPSPSTTSSGAPSTTVDPCPLSCTFDDDFCHWTQSIDDDFDWRRQKGPTESFLTGPSYDHTTGNGYYIYIEGNDASRGAVARLLSPRCRAQGPHCFRFWYHMFGVALTMELKVSVVKNGVLQNEWSEMGNKGDKWYYAEVLLDLSSNTQIILEGVRGNDYRSDIAVDDLSVVQGYCSGSVLTTTPTTTTSPTTSSSPPPITSDSCVVEGDPHYYTFDNQVHHFMGTCKYTLSHLCNDSSLPYFNIEAANEHRGAYTHVSYVKYIDIDVYGNRITLEKNRSVKVNGESEILPINYLPGLEVSLSGQYVLLTTVFGLKVRFDGNHRVEVTLPSTYKGKVCGMCGNYNENPLDDFLNPDGQMEPDSVSLGNSWQVGNDSSCSGSKHEPNCTEEEKEVIESNSFCGIITDANGPFRWCHSVLPPSAHFTNCIYDLCELKMDPDSLCRSLQSYADACQAHGMKVEPWRNATFCPIHCPSNSHYEPCGSACPATCVNPSAPSSCSLPCAEGCVCDNGFALYNNKCVPNNQCGCWKDGVHYAVGSAFWTDDMCSEKCSCPSAGSKLICVDGTCPEHQYCGISNGKPGCYPYTYGICRVHNDPYYNTFDKMTHSFMGICTYTLAKLCTNSTSLPYFNIEAKNEHRGNSHVSYVEKVYVEVYDHKIVMIKREPNRVLVNEMWRNLPVTLAGGSLKISRSGWSILLDTDFRLTVSYDTDHSVEVKVPTTYFNLTCGMCGNFNSRREDDYMMPNGEQAQNSIQLGNSWSTVDDPSCEVIPPTQGPCVLEELYKSDAFCGLLTSKDAPFSVCHSVINPESFFDTCVLEHCAGNQVLCQALQVYADACQREEVAVPSWRNSTFCPKPCRTNSHYNACTTACPATCVDPSAPENCSKPCIEGCECDDGYVDSGNTCVLRADCGCWYKEKYYTKGESFMEGNCEIKCQCMGNNRVECVSVACGPDEICKVQNGLLGCHQASTATCHIYGDPHYATFDGKVHHFQGSCNYTVAETCGNSSVGFSVTTRNEYRGNPSWTALNSVALSVNGIHIAVRKHNHVYVNNGLLTSCPASPTPGINISCTTSHTIISTNFGLELQFDGDQELFVRVKEYYKGSLCGLCGTYTNNQEDDFMKPDGVVVPDFNEFGNSWRVPDDEWPCNATTDPKPCPPALQQTAEEDCKVLTMTNGPFSPCHSLIPPNVYFESCVYDQCATGGSSDQLCVVLASYAAACEAAGILLGDWRKGTICDLSSTPPSPSTTSSGAPSTTVDPCPLSCTFDDDFCHWTQSIDDHFDWRRQKGPTESFLTGPSYDHTTGNGYYIYIEGNDASRGAVARLLSPRCRAQGPHCFRFWYHMFGVALTMELKVSVVKNGVLQNEWSEMGNKGDKWYYAEVLLDLSSNTQIILEGVRGNDYRSDIAVDDLSVVQGYCSGSVLTTTPTTTTSPTTSSSPPPITSDSCVVEGDPHYYTFDNQVHHFMGTCKYTLSHLCNDSSLPYFNIEAANEHRGAYTHVSYVKYVDIDVYGNRITLEKNRSVKVNGESKILPINYLPGLEVSLSGQYVLLTTVFGLKVRFDGNHRVEVTLPSTYKGKVCGMCGNYNENPLDDFLNPDGQMEPDSVSLGNSWQVGNDSSCSGSKHEPNCTEEEKEVIESNSFCGIITDANGPFRWCHSVLPPSTHFTNCIYDLCELKMDPDSLCRSLQSYADACQAHGMKVEPWRNATFCPIHCPSNSHYEPCGSACPATCVNPSAPSSCSLPCAEGCVCDNGFALYNNKCVPNNQCGCWKDGVHYAVGSAFWTDDMCSEKCSCPSAGSKLICVDGTCPEHQYCGISNGKPGCYPYTYGICRVHNDPYYNTFDKMTHSFMGICTYTLAKLCTNSTSLPYFNIEAMNEHRGNSHVSYVEKVDVEVYDHKIVMIRREPNRVLVNEMWRNLPVTLAGGSLKISRSGWSILLDTDFRLTVSYDTDHSVEVKVPTTYFNLTCGMCGNFNSRREDDYMMPNGEQAQNSIQLGNSWSTVDDPSCEVIPPTHGPCVLEELYKSDAFCGLLTSKDAPFSVCHSVINPESFFDTCVLEHCAGNQVLCQALQVYADACQREEVAVPSWRNSTFCPKPCRSNSHYNACMTACPATCVDPSAPENCSKPCIEGCECDDGYVDSGNTCVLRTDCGCWYKEKYYTKGESFMEGNCENKCQCMGNNRVECVSVACGPDEICKVQNGLLGCHQASTATCHIYGDPHYATFDGKVHHFQGSCNYTVAETCGNSSVGFSVTTRNEYRGNPSWTALNSVALSVNGIHIAVRKHNHVYVNNGLLTGCPASPTPGINISCTTSHTIISTNFGLELQFDGDQELFVRVKEYYKGSLCGLCGTYTNNQEDDFMKPDGVVVPDFNEFGNSWRVPDDEWLCNATTDPKPCPPALQQTAEEDCKVLTMTNGPFSPCHSLIPPNVYFESCVYDQCATGGSSDQLCVVLASYAAACEAAGILLGDWRKGTICDLSSTPPSPSTTSSGAPSTTVDPCPLSCTFDDDFCHWTQSIDDDFDWRRQKGPTESFLTGPSYDHTTGNGYYIYIEGNDASRGAVARLLSPRCRAQGPHCFRFWYHMFGVALTMELKVSVVKNGVLQNEWSEMGNKGDKWYYAEVLLDLSSNTQIILEGVRGNDYRSDIAVDDLSVVQGYCSGSVLTTTPTTTTSPTTSSSPPPITSDSCVVEGDPHYYTFDNQVHHFMGTCKYTLSHLCNDSSLPYFNIEAANEHRGAYTHVSYVKYVDIDVYGNRITLEKNRSVKVNGESEILPINYLPGLEVSLSGQYVLLTTVFGLKVRFDGNHRVEVTLPSTYKGKVCGMCGNYNENPLDDFLNPDGQMEPDSVSLGNSWQVGNDSSCSGSKHEPNCTEEEKEVIESNSFCGIITDANGPFRWCHSVLPPSAHFTNCIYDLCELKMDPDSLCRSLQSYADACQAHGMKVEPWRNATFCPIHCPSNSHYEPCGSACPATCVNPSAPSSCSLPCAEGCVCDNGFALYNNKCVPNNQCGCWKDGVHYAVGSAFWTDDMCSEKCSCPSAGSKLICVDGTCPEHQYCGISNGKPGCYPYTYGICRVHNDPYYNTFDKMTHSFMGICTYTLAKLCTNSTSLPYFNIEAKNEHRGNSHVSYVEKVYVEVYDHKIVMIKREPNRVLVNEMWRNLPVTLAGGSLKISRSGWSILLDTDFRLTVSYDTDHSVEVKVPTTYFNLTCGMCGNFNSRREDDYMMPNGEQAQNSIQLGNSWSTVDDPSCEVIPPTQGPCVLEELYKSDAFCGLLTSKDAPFSVCHSVINPESFFDTCVLEHCAGNQVLCQALQVYADACQREEVAVPSWRNSTFCPKPCRSNSHYNACTTACPATCVDPSAPENCSKPCIEGCECDDGYVDSGNTCVLRADCGCWYKEKYYTKGESFMEGNCEIKCQCMGNNRVECVSVACGPDEICKVQNGLLGCHQASTATCHIYGDPHYATFDGKVHHFQGSCNYTVAETCGNSSVGFSVTTRNEYRGNPSWTALNSVALSVNGIHIAVRKHNHVYVNNGLLTSCPASPTPGINISCTTSHTIISTNFGLELQFDGDQELFVRVKEYYKGSLCGLCGTYTNNQEDDFMKPDGVVVPDFNEFGNSWRVPDDGWPCNATTDPKPCPPALQQTAEEDCKVLTMTNGPFSPCHSLIPPNVYFESCVYDQCATGGSSDQLCVVLASYAAACEAAGILLGDWRKGTICDLSSTPPSPSTTSSGAPSTTVDPCPLSCTFDDDFCHWTQSIDDHFDWRRQKGPTESFLTGPSYDHTTGNGYYIYIEGNDASRGAVARLLSPRCRAQGPHCFRFWYHMFGVALTMELKVSVVKNGVLQNEWSEMGNKGDKWYYAEVLLDLSSNTQIILEGVRGNDYRSDIAVDDLSVVQGYCSGSVLTTTPTTTTSPTTSSSPPPITSDSCVVEGDPHYYTFDNQVHHFMGTCKYTLSHLCNDSSLPYFNIEAANEHRGAYTHVSYVKYVDIDVYGNRITLEKNRSVKVNGESEILPINYLPGLEVSLSGQYVLLTTVFGLKVRFDGNHRVEVTLPSTYKGKVCGMCGNYNENPLDDFLNPDGQMEPDSVSLGNSWQVGNDSSCSGSKHEPNCTEEEKEVIESNSFCGIITDANGPFRWCHSVLPPSAHFTNCIYDLCELKMDPDSLCRSLQSYADACQAHGMKVEPWRNATFCPIHCPSNSHYEPCGSACPATCVKPSAPSSCSLPCAEGCVCDNGFALYNNKCVPNNQCGCWKDGVHYAVGSAFWTDDTCSEKCSCPSAGSKLICVDGTCPEHQYCGISNGKPGCYPYTYGICRVHNDPYYNTFDKVTHSFMGICTYTLAKLCTNSTSLPYFNIEATNEHRGNSHVSYVQKVDVEVYDHKIVMIKREPNRVLVNERWTNLPVLLAGGALKITKSGRYSILETNFRLTVSYDTDHSVQVKIPTTYFNQTCGMCGNFNNRREDDYMMPNGQQAQNSIQLGNSWVTDDDDPSCVEPPRPPPSVTPGPCEEEDLCKLLISKDTPFSVCHSVINPESFFDACVFEHCAGNCVLCQALEVYADACQQEGVTIPIWRNNTFCSLPCSSNSHYNACTTACPATCVDPSAPENCSKPCIEGCECDDGYVDSGNTCVLRADCGCWYKEKYYTKGESFMEGNCQIKCQCMGNNRVECVSVACGPDEICKVQNGLLGCHQASTATCHIYGDPHYATFDGKVHHFQGSCNYTVAETCGNSSVGFSVTTRNEYRGNPSWTALNSVALSVNGIHIAVRKHNHVYVNNGLLTSCPASPTPGINISCTTSHTIISTNFGLELQFDGDQELFVRVKEYYKGSLCGLCGTYTNNQEDDFMKPDGVVVPDFNEFGNSWRVPDDEWPCNATTDPKPCPPALQQTAEEDCKVLTMTNGPFSPCHSLIPPNVYFESCVYDQCATGGSSDQLCVVLASYAAACEAAGILLGDWRKGTICDLSSTPPSPSTTSSGAPSTTDETTTHETSIITTALPPGSPIPTSPPAQTDKTTVYETPIMITSLPPVIISTAQSTSSITDETSMITTVLPPESPTTTPSPAPTDTTTVYETTTIVLPPVVTTTAQQTTTVPDTVVEPTTVEPTTVPEVEPTTVPDTVVEPTTVEPTTVPEVEPTTVPDTVVEPTTVEATTVPEVEPTTVPDTVVEPTTVPDTVVETTTVEPTTVPDTVIEPTTVEPTTVPDTVIETTTVESTTVPDVEPTTVPDTVIETTTVESTTVPDVEPTTVPDTVIETTTVESTTVPDVESTTVPDTVIETTTVESTTVPDVEPTTVPDTVVEPTTVFEPTTVPDTVIEPTTVPEVEPTTVPDTVIEPTTVEPTTVPEVEPTTVEPTTVPEVEPTTVPDTVVETTTVEPTTVPSSTTRIVTILTTSSPKTTTKTQRTTFSTTKSPIIDRGTCSASGDPHYNTFDNRVHHYMGNCTYTLSKLCNQSTHLPYFDVSTSNEHRSSNTKVSYVKSVHVFVYGNLITLLKNKKVHVNGRKANLPVSIGDKITIQIGGSYVLLRTDFELRVQYDGNHYVDVTLPSPYKGQLCGLCGNYNGDPSDDIVKPDGNAAASSTELGDSWIVPENGTICTNGSGEICDPVIKAEAEKNTSCGMITDPSGVFKDCHSKVPPKNYFDSCVIDVCSTGGESTSLCYALQSYAEQCTKAGICIEWRTSALCPISCAGGSHFKSCGSSCPTTCSGPVTFSSCDSSPVEGCFCDEDYVLSGDKCVPESECGCTDMNNNYYQAGESWFTQNNCAERCTCNGNNSISCIPWACGVQEKCEVQDGVLGCHGTGKASCHVAGDPHYFTFDKVMHTFVGTCTYTLVHVCNATNVIPVTISGKNEDRGQRGATYLREVYVDVYNTRITLQKSRKTLFNQERVRTPVEGRTRGISIGTVGIYTVVETDFGMTVKFDGDHHLEIVLPDSYYSKVCGMCGNYNGRGDDELLMPNGLQARNVSEFGNSWKDDQESDSGCLPDIRDDLGPPCTTEQKPVIEGQCQVLLSDAFKPCQHLIKPQLFIQNCVYDMCKYDGMLSTLCAIAQSYVDACKREGVTIKWRNSTLCPLPCPTNSHYTDCASPCPPTCNDIYASGTCDKPVACMEGCICNDGHVLSDDQCVPLDDCGCRDDKDNYYPVGESWITPHCFQKCQCRKGNNIKCRSYGCEPGEICILNNKGNYACKPTGFAKCSVTGDPHYLTFDGLVHHFQGKDTYIVAQTPVSISDSLPQFRVEGKNAPLITKVGVTYLKEISTNVYNHTVLFKQKKQVVLDGVRIDPPAQPHEGIRISQRSTRIHMETDFGLSITFDGVENADITLPNTYKKKVEGLCGNFDGKHKNDFTKPDGAQVNNVNVFGESWKVQNGKTTSRLRRALTSEEDSDGEELQTGFSISCLPNQLQMVNSSAYCGLLTDPSGPFKACHQTIAADLYYSNCIFDLCADFESTALLCSNLGQYALACQEAGITLGDWRKNSRCEMSCPPNSRYSKCMTACPASCSDLAAPSDCDMPCQEGCECLPGYVLSGFSCVPYKECGCTYLNKYYKAGERFTTDDCSQTCTCTESSTVNCQRTRCSPQEVCTIANLTRGCYIPGPCLENPCKNGGTCVETTMEGKNKIAFCQCLEAYQGDVCEADKPRGEPFNPTIYIVVGTVLAVILISAITALVLWRCNARRKKKNPKGSRATDYFVNGTEDRLGFRQEPGWAVNAAYDEE